ncbi:UNVERIFIED_CONTAM: hypothetical protein FKN15_065065 [Acipenser sinensis]
MSGPGQDSEPEAKVLHTKRLYRAVVESVHKLDLIISNKSSYREVFKPENISLRNKLRELCVKLMFLHPVDYGRKAEELLWRKVYYEVIQLIKTNKKHVHSRSALECAYRTHLIAGVGFYQHLLLYIQSHYQLELQDCIDWTHVTDPLIGRKKAVSATAKEMDWAQMACHRCLVYLGDLARYQNELAGVEAELLAERFYHQALSVTPHVGMPFNQLGTLAGSKYYNVEATYYYLRWSKDVKRLLVSFMYLQSLLQPKNSLLESELTSLCQSVLEDFNLVLFYLPSASHSSSGCEEEEDHESRYSFVPDVLVFRMVVTCLMVVHNLKRAGSKQYSAAIAFTLAMFSHLVNHVNIHLQAELEEGESGVPVLHTDDLEVKDGVTLTPEEGTLQNGTAEEEEEEEEEEERSGKGADGQKKPSNSTDKTKKSGKKKYSRLSRLRRRRYAGKEDESDLSEGFESEGERGGRVGGRRVGAAVVSTAVTRAKHKGADWDSGSEKSEEDYEEEEEEAETAFDVETDSDMNSQESRSDLEDIEDEKTEIAGVPDSLDSADSKPLEKAEPSPAVNGPPPSSSGGSDSSIASNLQAMSSQLFQTKRCFRLAPTFSNVLLRPCSAPEASGGGSSPQPTALDQTPLASSNPSATPHTASDNDGGSDSEGSVESNQSCRNEKTLLERLEILTNQGLLPAVKVFLDWLRANTDIIVMCAQSSQSLWNRLSVLLNLLPDSRKILEAEVPLCEEVSELLSSCERPDLQQTLLLPEDVALRHLPALRAAHKRLDMERESPTLSTLQESVVRLSCIRSFGHFLTRLQGNVLHFNPEAGIFTSISQSEQENLLQQARAQYIRCQRESGKSFERHKLKRQDSDAWHLYKMVDSCRQLTVSQGSGEEDTAGMVTILTGFHIEDVTALSPHMQAALQAVSVAGIELKNILEFYKQWKEMG